VGGVLICLKLSNNFQLQSDQFFEQLEIVPPDDTPRILIVEDEWIVADDLKTTLQSSGYEVVDIVSLGETAVERAQDLMPDLILMDIHLAGTMTGIEAAETINSILDIPVIYLTAFADNRKLPVPSRKGILFRFSGRRITASSPQGFISGLSVVVRCYPPAMDLLPDPCLGKRYVHRFPGFHLGLSRPVSNPYRGLRAKHNRPGTRDMELL